MPLSPDLPPAFVPFVPGAVAVEEETNEAIEDTEDTDSSSSSSPTTSPVESASIFLPIPDIPDIIPNILPAGQVHLFSGASGAGKTALTFQLLSSIHNQSPFFSLSPRKPAFIGYLASDRTWSSHDIWLHTVGLSDLPHYSLIQDLSATGSAIRVKKFGDRFQLFRRCIAKMVISQGLASESSSIDQALSHLPTDSLLVVDPISLFIGGDLNKYDTVFSHMVDLNQFCIRHSCTILGIAHAGKQKSDPAQRYTRPQDRIVGTTAQTGCVGTVFHLSPPSETMEEWSEFAYVPHHAAAASMRLSRDSNGLFLPVAPATPTRREQKKVEKALRFSTKVLELLPEDYSSVSITILVDSAKSKHQLNRAMVYRHLQTLSDLGLAETPSRGLWARTRKN